jgi:diguanylate cyclase (GGDEF)-like protein
MRSSLRFLALVGLYVAGVAFVVQFVVTPSSVTLFWPMAGLAYAVVIRYGLRWVLFVPVAVLIAHLTPVSPVEASFIPFSMAANTLGTLAGGWLVRRVPLPNQMDIRFAFRALRGGLLLSAVSAGVGVVGLVASGFIPQPLAADALVKWFLGDLLGVTAIAPALLLLGFGVREDARSVHDYGSEGEGLAWNIALALSFLLMAWGGAYGSAYALGLSSLPLAVMVWSALRFPPLRTAIAVALTVMLIGVLIGLDVAGFTAPERPLDSAILLAYLCLNAILPMILALAVHERRTATGLMLRRASTDILTDLPNRSAFEAQVRRILADPNEPPVALAYIDLDNFALINDTASHEAGDALIASVADTLRAERREGDLLAHLGADEFAVLLRNCNATMARERALTLVRAIEITRCVWSNQVLQTTASVGVVPVRPGEAGFPELLSQADAACFTAKELGGNRVTLAGALAGDDRTTSMRWAVRIRESLDRHRFELYAQTIQPLQDNAPSTRGHFEILLRMREDRGDVLSPVHFMPAAERFRLGVRIDREVLDNTLAWLEQHPESAARVDTCSINLTGEALVDEGFIGFVAERLRRSRFPADRLCLEITETSAVRDLERAQRFINEMRALGCRFALDDFGTGFCSFAYLRSLDVDYFKIDGSFVREMDTSPLAAEVVRSITHIAHLLDKRTIAEHTENRALLESLRALGVDFAQGYAIDRPEPLATYFERLVAREAQKASVVVPIARGGV